MKSPRLPLVNEGKKCIHTRLENLWIHAEGDPHKVVRMGISVHRHQSASVIKLRT